MKPGRDALLGLGALFLFALLFFHDVVAGGVFFFGDFHAAFEPLRAILGRALRQGLPLWNPALGNGQPLLASPFAQALYPPNLLFALSGLSAARLLTLLVITHVLWGAAGVWLLLRRRGEGPSARLAGALVFAFCGISVSATYLVALTTTGAWVPWLLLVFEIVREARTPAARARASGLFAAVVAAMLLAGEPSSLAAAFLGLALFWLFDPARSPRLRHAAWAAAGIAGGAVLASPLLVAALRYLPATVRSAGFPYAVL
ncbi:MAG TPA: hypothetical protein VKF32_01650, partial [Thermoanaerobaculia bacterium]|nr:hypothetical protein [Thermoanaerobaculia bacterium]